MASSTDVPNWDKNLFAYCDNDPINRVDQGGDRWSWHSIVKGITVAAAVVAVGSFVVGISGIGVVALVGGGYALTITSAGAAAFGVSVYSGAVATLGYINMAKGGKQNVKDTGLIDIPSDEIEKRYRDPNTSKKDKQRYKKELKGREEYNKNKRQNNHHSR